MDNTERTYDKSYQWEVERRRAVSDYNKHHKVTYAFRESIFTQ